MALLCWALLLLCLALLLLCWALLLLCLALLCLALQPLALLPLALLPLGLLPFSLPPLPFSLLPLGLALHLQLQTGDLPAQQAPLLGGTYGPYQPRRAIVAVARRHPLNLSPIHGTLLRS